MRIIKEVLNKAKHINYTQIFLGGLKMNSYKVPESITKKVQSIGNDEKKKKKLEEIYSELDSVSKKYSGSQASAVPDKIELEKMEFNRPSEEEIKSNSEELLKDYKNTEISNINDEFKLKEDELYSNKENAKETTEKAKNNLGEYYSEAINNAENQALKRGLSRSSIIVNQLDAFEKEKINDYKALDEKLGSEINAINFELNALTTQKQTALNNFDVTYAVKLQEKINSLNEELNKKESEVTKYNNEIAIKEAEFNKEVDELKNELDNNVWDNTNDLINLYGKYGQNVVEKVKSDELYNKAKEIFSNLSKEEIKEILNDSGFKTRMGSNYEKLIKEFS